jgi:hypothetical protein
VRDPSPPPTWSSLVAEIEREIDRVGWWSGEARVLRDAADYRRLGAPAARLLRGWLELGGYECEGSLRYESEPIVVRRAGAGELARIVASLLPAIREADRAVPAGADHRDEVVARHALRAWRGQ